MLTVAPTGSTNRVTRWSRPRFSSRQRNVTGSAAVLRTHTNTRTHTQTHTHTHAIQASSSSTNYHRSVNYLQHITADSLSTTGEPFKTYKLVWFTCCCLKALGQAVFLHHITPLTLSEVLEL